MNQQKILHIGTLTLQFPQNNNDISMNIRVTGEPLDQYYFQKQWNILCKIADGIQIAASLWAFHLEHGTKNKSRKHAVALFPAFGVAQLSRFNL